MHGRSEKINICSPSHISPSLYASLQPRHSISRYFRGPLQYLIFSPFPTITLIHTTLTGPANKRATMKTSLLTTPLVLALGLKSVTALPTSTDAAAVKAEEILAPAGVAETLARPSTPALEIMEKRTFNPLRGCWKHHCKENPPFPPPFPRPPKENPNTQGKKTPQATHASTNAKSDATGRTRAGSIRNTTRTARSGTRARTSAIICSAGMGIGRRWGWRMPIRRRRRWRSRRRRMRRWRGGSDGG